MSDKLVFDEKTHLYTLNGSELVSVTKLIKSHFPEFEAEKIAGYVAKSRGVSVQMVLDEWAKKRDASIERGNRIHSLAEVLMLNEKCDIVFCDKKEKEEALRLELKINQLKEKYELVSCEIQMYSEKYMIAGTADLIMLDRKNNEAIIFDWKTNAQIKKKGHRGSKGLGELSHLEDCNFIHYALQLNIYEYLYGVECKKKLIHITDKAISEIDIPDLSKEVDVILRNRRKEILDVF